jgi:hypothetical protein
MKTEIAGDVTTVVGVQLPSPAYQHKTYRLQINLYALSLSEQSGALALKRCLRYLENRVRGQRSLMLGRCALGICWQPL